MPSHQERVRRNNLCPYCHESLLDGEHTVSIINILNSRGSIIGCPKHSKSNHSITFIPAKRLGPIEEVDGY